MVKKLTKKQKEALRSIVDYKCQWCHNHEADVGTLNVHRIRRGINLGEYTPNNILLLCSKCHKSNHYREF